MMYRILHIPTATYARGVGCNEPKIFETKEDAHFSLTEKYDWFLLLKKSHILYLFSGSIYGIPLKRLDCHMHEFEIIEVDDV